MTVTNPTLGQSRSFKHVLQAWTATRLVLVRTVSAFLVTNRSMRSDLSQHVVALIIDAVVVHHLHAFELVLHIARDVIKRGKPIYHAGHHGHAGDRTFNTIFNSFLLRNNFARCCSHACIKPLGKYGFATKRHLPINFTERA